MPLRHTLTRTGIALAAGTLIAVSGATPALALADNSWNSGRGGNSHVRDNGNNNDGRFDDDRRDDERFDDGLRNPRISVGRVTSRNGLALLTRPDRNSRIVRIARFGERVEIFCKAVGDRIGGNPLWYLLADGTWSWGTARHIEIFGPTPRWC